MGLLSDAPSHAALLEEAAGLGSTHLRQLLQTEDRPLHASFGGVVLDYSRQKITPDTLAKLEALYAEQGVASSMAAAQAGAMQNPTEERSVLHTALRASREQVIEDKDGHDVVPDVYAVLDRIKSFSEEIRSGARLGATGKPLTNVVVIGIGGSYLGPEFVCEALRFHEPSAQRSAGAGRTLRFLANVDPTDVYRATADLNPEETLVVVISKTFTTAETMLNASTVKKWLVESLGEDAVPLHMVACSSALDKTASFGIEDENVFGFWVGGRVSVSCSVGALPMALHFGYGAVEEFHTGLRQMDEHVLTAPLRENIPALMGLLGVWNISYLDLNVRAVLPYSQALARFPAHIQQLDMESNGKGVAIDGTPLPYLLRPMYGSGEFIFGEPGTNGQHSFYQLLHQGRPAACELIGFVSPPTDVLYGETLSIVGDDGAPTDGWGTVSNHDELMSNFFAQADALALGKTAEECEAEGVPPELVPHKTFQGDRVSMQLLLPELSPLSLGHLLGIYEHRTAVQGALWNINSFDQWGVELGKALATDARGMIAGGRQPGADTSVAGMKEAGAGNAATASLLSHYLSSKL